MVQFQELIEAVLKANRVVNRARGLQFHKDPEPIPTKEEVREPYSVRQTEGNETIEIHDDPPQKAPPVP